MKFDEITISDLWFRKFAVLSAVIIAATLFISSLVKKGLDPNDVGALQNYYVLFAVLYGVGAMGIILQIFCLKSALEAFRIYTLISLFILLFVAYNFILNYDIMYGYMDVSNVVRDIKLGIVGVETLTAPLEILISQAEIVSKASYYIMGYGLLQFIIGILPNDFIRPVKKSKKTQQKEVVEELSQRMVKGDANTVKKAYLLTINDASEREIMDNFIIGKGENCTYQIDDMYLNPQHAIIEKKDHIYTLKDLDSKNKTYVNKVELNPDTTYELHSDDEIIMADVVFRFELR